MNALILVDLQNDFLPGGALAVPDGNEVLAIANRLLPRFELAVATQDWHPAAHLSFADHHAGRQPGDQIELDGLIQTLWPPHCVQESKGAELASELDTHLITKVFPKGTDPRIDSYGGFFDNGYRRSTGLGDYLRLQGVTSVYVLGLATDYCVKFTAIDACKLGFRTYLVMDGCRGIDLEPGDIEQAVSGMQRAGVIPLTSETVIRQLSAGSAWPQVLAETKHLRLVRRGDWDFVQRRKATGVAVIAALTDAEELILVEQYRPPVDARVVELPAGLVNDAEAESEESAAEAARRELWEETGYTAAKLERALDGPSSAGLTDEMVTFFVATELEQTAHGGGVEGEEIQVHKVPLDKLHEWIDEKRRQGCRVDARLYTGVYLLQERLST